MEIYALVGKSGTGKSYKALEVAYKNNIKYIIDDGLLIHKNKIIAGVSAKQANTVMQAVKIAIFKEKNHRELVKQKIREEQIEKILVLGTSNKMISRIIERLEIQDIYQLINIEDISSKKEIKVAKKCRENGQHIIPVPMEEIKFSSSELSINPLRRFFKRKNNTLKQIEKTIIKPVFSKIEDKYITFL